MVIGEHTVELAFCAAVLRTELRNVFIDSDVDEEIEKVVGKFTDDYFKAVCGTVLDVDFDWMSDWIEIGVYVEIDEQVLSPTFINCIV